MLYGIPTGLRLDAALEIEIEPVLPGTLAQWTGFDFQEIDVAQSEHADGLEKRTRDVLHAENDGCLGVFHRHPGGPR